MMLELTDDETRLLISGLGWGLSNPNVPDLERAPIRELLRKIGEMRKQGKEAADAEDAGDN